MHVNEKYIYNDYENGPNNHKGTKPLRHLRRDTNTRLIMTTERHNETKNRHRVTHKNSRRLGKGTK